MNENNNTNLLVPEELQNIVEDAVPEWPRHKQYAAAKKLMSMIRDMLLKEDGN